MINTKKCLICNEGRKNNTLYWHKDPDTSEMWCWCNKCNRGYSMRSYCHAAGLSLQEFLSGDFDVQEAKPNEVTAQAWPSRFVPLSDPRAEEGVEYIKTRGLLLEGDMYYDMERKGIVFPYYFDNTFCGAQTRFLVPKIHDDGEVQKMDTLPGTRLGLLFYGWNQSRFIGDVKGVIVCEGSFNSISINQALNLVYGGIARNPWRAIACSGSGATKFHQEALKELKDQGMKIVVAPDTDEAGMKMLKKFKDSDTATHYALTGCTEDWNEVCKRLGHLDFAKYFLSTVKDINE